MGIYNAFVERIDKMRQRGMTDIEIANELMTNVSAMRIQYDLEKKRSKADFAAKLWNMSIHGYTLDQMECELEVPKSTILQTLHAIQHDGTSSYDIDTNDDYSISMNVPDHKRNSDDIFKIVTDTILGYAFNEGEFKNKIDRIREVIVTFKFN